MAGITLLTGLSWLAVMNSVGKWTLTVFSLAGQQAASGAQRYRNDEESTASPAARIEMRKPKLVIADDEPEVEEKPKKSKLQILKTIEQPALQETEVFKPARKKDTKVTEDFDDDKFLNAYLLYRCLISVRLKSNAIPKPSWKSFQDG
jgi:S-DNA-T family DNA segregation ATPase FtsK/SpoIIIE